MNTNDTEKEFRNMRITDSDFFSKIFRFLQKKLGIQEGRESPSVQASKTIIMMWGLFMSSSMRAAIYLELNYERNLETYKSMNLEQIENLLTITHNLVVDNFTEILYVKTIDCRSMCWTRSILAHDQVKRWSKAKVRVHSDSVL